MKWQGGYVRENGTKVKEAAVTYLKLFFGYSLAEGTGGCRLQVVFES
jgi:hypothetical protein